MTDYQPTIGIEIHVQLATKSKMFCSCDNHSVESEPNTNICPVCLGYPGSLPLPNAEAVNLAIRLGHGLNAKIARQTKFDRKNYFYPDNPKGYQITQFDQPIVGPGSIEILVDGEFKTIGIERAHLEEDAGKLTHPTGKDYSLVDFNRAGTPLLEIVSMPDMHSPQEARRYLQEIYAIATSLKITHGNMQHGNMKFDLNISVSKNDKLGTRTELKNLNSFRNAERALTYEIKRQIGELEKGNPIVQETRGWDDAKAKTFSQRSKEEAHDYRYFPEPDIPPIVVTEAMIKTQLDKVTILPIEIRKKLVEIGLLVDDQDLLIGQKHTLELFHSAVTEETDTNQIRRIIGLLVGEYQAWLKFKAGGSDDAVGEVKPNITGQDLRQLVEIETSGEISSKMSKEVFADMCASGKPPLTIIQAKGFQQISDVGELHGIIQKIVTNNPQAVADFKAGNAKALGFFVGQVMQATKGQANPGVVNTELRAILEKA